MVSLQKLDVTSAGHRLTMVADIVAVAVETIIVVEDGAEASIMPTHLLHISLSRLDRGHHLLIWQHNKAMRRLHRLDGLHQVVTITMVVAIITTADITLVVIRTRTRIRITIRAIKEGETRATVVDAIKVNMEVARAATTMVAVEMITVAMVVAIEEVVGFEEAEVVAEIETVVGEVAETTITTIGIDGH